MDWRMSLMAYTLMPIVIATINVAASADIIIESSNSVFTSRHNTAS